MFCRSSGCIKIIILLLGNLYELTQATIEVSSVTRPWSKAARRCLLFGSNNTGDVQKDKITIPSSLSDGLYWIGATVKQTAWFEFLGNNSLDVRGVSGTSLNNSNHTFYDCYFECNVSENFRIFALMEKKCYCFPFSLPMNSQSISLPKVSHYLVNSENPSNIMGSIRGDCVAFTKKEKGGFHEVLNCETSLPPICRSGVGQSNSSWVSAVNSCLDGVQSNYHALYENIATGGPWWTGITRRTIRQWADGPKGMPLFGCLALKIQANETSLQEVLCDTKLQSLCIKGTIRELQTKTSNDDMILAISVTATCVFVVLLIFVSVALWKIKNNKKSKIARMPSVHNQNYEGEMEGAIIPPLYAEVERNNIYSGVSSSNQNSSADDTYDHCKIQSMGRTLVVPGDLYDSVNNVTSDKDYDYLHTT